jgi:hypothetical protein
LIALRYCATPASALCFARTVGLRRHPCARLIQRQPRRASASPSITIRDSIQCLHDRSLRRAPNASKHQHNLRAPAEIQFSPSLWKITCPAFAVSRVRWAGTELRPRIGLRRVQLLPSKAGCSHWCNMLVLPSERKGLSRWTIACALAAIHYHINPRVDSVLKCIYG